MFGNLEKEAGIFDRDCYEGAEAYDKHVRHNARIYDSEENDCDELDEEDEETDDEDDEESDEDD
jgi:hypothetical protein